MSGTQSQRDRAFSETADPTAYVPRDATESALGALQSWSREGAVGPTVACLTAAPGLGKTFLLRLVESRLERRASAAGGARRAIYLPYAGLLPRDLCEWVYGLLGRAAPFGSGSTDEAGEADDSRVALEALTALADSGDSPFFLLMDDADSMPPETIRMWVDGLPREGSPLRLLLALNPDAKSSRLLASLDSLGILEASLDQPMSEEETATYLKGRMRWAGLGGGSEGWELDEVAMRRIHTLSGGVPLQVHRFAESIFASEAAERPSDLDTKLRREDWLGSPIEDDL